MQQCCSNIFVNLLQYDPCMTTSSWTLEAPATDPASVHILDAALDVLQTLGIRKTTIEDIARKASVDRVTVYRRVGTKNDVVKAVLAREATRVFERAAGAAAKAQTLDERVAIVFTELVLDLRGSALFKRLMTVDPETTFPQVSSEAGGLLRLAVQFAITVLLDDQEAVNLLDLEARVEIVVRLVHSMFLAPDAAVDLTTRAQLMGFARNHVAPMVAARNI